MCSPNYRYIESINYLVELPKYDQQTLKIKQNVRKQCVRRINQPISGNDEAKQNGMQAVLSDF